MAPLEGKTANTPRLGPVSTSRQRIAELARQALGMAVAIAWLPGPAGTRRRVAKLSVEEPDAAEPARPDLWGARVSNDPGLPDPATLRELVTVARSRWPIEQQYRELKDDLGLDHFEGRSYRGWGHHTVLTALAFTFLQLERMRSTAAPPPTLPHVRFWVREIMAVLYIIGNRKLLNLIVSFQRSTPLRR